MDFNQKAYSQALEHIFALSPSVQSAGFASGAYKPGLEGMQRFDTALGHPWRKYRCIHVAGTNGKGSVSSIIASALAQDARRVGLYTSPHISDFRERMRVVTGAGWYMPTEREVWDFLQEYDAAMKGLSFFEITTGMAFWWFARQKVDIAVVEVGLGGRLDSTNIIAPELCIITSIGLDHCAMLGGTRAAIAGEKAGIFKPGVPAVVASEDEETAPVFLRAAIAAGCPLIFADSVPGSALERHILSKMDLRGPCQEQNLHTSAVALAVLSGSGQNTARAFDKALTFSKSAILHTAQRSGFRGRWERLQESPEVICDIGHNPPALKINFGRLEALGRPLWIVYGVMRDKDLAGIAPLMPSAAHYILVAPDTPRALPEAELEKQLRELRPELNVQGAGSVAEGISKALENASAAPGEPLVYIGGSTFVVTEAVDYYKHHRS